MAGPLSMAHALATTLRVHHALVAMPEVAREDLLWMLDDWSTVFRHVILIPDLFGVASLWVSARDLGGILGLELRQNLLVPGTDGPNGLWTLRAPSYSAWLLYH